MSRSKVVDERQELKLGKPENDGGAPSAKEARPVVGLVLGVVGVVLMVLSFLLPS